VALYETLNDPDQLGAPLETNPYSVLARPGQQIVLDAAGNDMLRVFRGQVSTLAVFPNRMVAAPPFLGLPPGATIPMQSVPVAVVQGPDGAYYVGEFTGFPFPLGAARIYRVVPGQAPQVFTDGFTNIIDIGFGPSGDLFVLEHTRSSLLNESADPIGRLVRVAKDGTKTTLASDGLVEPTGLAIGPDGAVFVTNFGTSIGGGQVVRVHY
jgi:hypothetical protein